MRLEYNEINLAGAVSGPIKKTAYSHAIELRIDKFKF